VETLSLPGKKVDSVIDAAVGEDLSEQDQICLYLLLISQYLALGFWQIVTLELCAMMTQKKLTILKGSMRIAMSLTIKKTEFCFSRGSTLTLDCCQTLILYISHMPFFQPPKERLYC